MVWLGSDGGGGGVKVFWMASRRAFAVLEFDAVMLENFGD